MNKLKILPFLLNTVLLLTSCSTIKDIRETNVNDRTQELINIFNSKKETYNEEIDGIAIKDNYKEKTIDEDRKKTTITNNEYRYTIDLNNLAEQKYIKIYKETIGEIKTFTITDIYEYYRFYDFEYDHHDGELNTKGALINIDENKNKYTIDKKSREEVMNTFIVNDVQTIYFDRYLGDAISNVTYFKQVYLRPSLYPPLRYEIHFGEYYNDPDSLIVKVRVSGEQEFEDRHYKNVVEESYDYIFEKGYFKELNADATIRKYRTLDDEELIETKVISRTININYHPKLGSIKYDSNELVDVIEDKVDIKTSENYINQRIYQDHEMKEDDK